jgi:hypothetical protein
VVELHAVRAGERDLGARADACRSGWAAAERDAALGILLRPLDADGVAVASLPESTGVAIESLRTAIGILQKRGFLERSGRAARLTDLGAAAREDLAAISTTVEREAEWSEPARSLLEGLLTDDAPLWPRIDPPPGSWRSKVPRPRALPWHPIPRQGGHPDGV